MRPCSWSFAVLLARAADQPNRENIHVEAHMDPPVCVYVGRYVGRYVGGSRSTYLHTYIPPLASRHLLVDGLIDHAGSINADRYIPIGMYIHS